MKHVLEVDSVQKYFEHKLVVSDVYLKCETGDIIGLLGRNGSGKSTLLKILFGIVPADYKFVRIDGKLKRKTSELLKEAVICLRIILFRNRFRLKKRFGYRYQKRNILIFVMIR